MSSDSIGRILKGVGSFYTVLSAEGKYCVCKARGLFRKKGQTPLPGDEVRFSEDKSGDGYLLEILPRRNELLRPAVANVDSLLIVVSATEPLPDLELVDKLLLFCSVKNIDPVLVINKCDHGCEASIDAVIDQYSGALSDIVPVSAESGYGLEKLEPLIFGKTVCLAGQSAVGKSSILNKLLGLDLKTGRLSEKTERGRHTTRHAELLPLAGGGFAVDTPGFSMLDSVPLEPEDIPKAYPEFAASAGKCRFMGCMHVSEPDCDVKRRVDKGDINKERYSRYVKIVREAVEARRHMYD